MSGRGALKIRRHSSHAMTDCNFRRLAHWTKKNRCHKPQPSTPQGPSGAAAGMIKVPHKRRGDHIKAGKTPSTAKHKADNKDVRKGNCMRRIQKTLLNLLG